MEITIPQAVIFDLDGTLIDSAPDLHACANKMLAELEQADLSLELVTSFVGNGVDKLVKRCLATVGLPESGETFEQAAARFRVFYNEKPSEFTRPYPGVMDFLQALQDNTVKMAVCTNKPEGLARKILENLGMAGYFAAITGGDSLPVLKPDPRPLFHTLEQLGVTADQALYIGDSETDFKTAINADMTFAFFTEGYCHNPIDGVETCFSFADFAALRIARPG